MNDTGVISREKRRVTNREQRYWSSTELAELRKLAPLGEVVVAELLGRSITSVRGQAYRQRISMRRDGERRGLLLGQPRGVSLVAAAARYPDLAQIRENVFEQRADIERIDRRVRLLARGAPLCPACGRRPQEVERTGLCEDCHTRELAHAHAMEADRAEADRHLDRERQRKHRRRAKAS